MTASDIALSDSASGYRRQGGMASDRNEPQGPSRHARTGRLTESYRRLWQPPDRRPAHRQALGQPYVWAGDEEAEQTSTLWPDRADWPDRANWTDTQPESPAGQDDSPSRHDPLVAAAVPTERAVIGDSLRVPIAWCQEGSCIAWYADSSALGEADVRARALAAGWCMDAFGHMVCPDCQQRHYLWIASPLVPTTGRTRRPAAWPAGQAGAAGRHRVQY